MYAEDFSFEIVNDILIEKINLNRATRKEALIFKERLENYLLTKKYKIIVDLGDCYFVDSTFIGVIVVILKKIYEKSGELKIIVKNEMLLNTFKEIKMNRVLNLYSSREEALASFINS